MLRRRGVARQRNLRLPAAALALAAAALRPAAPELGAQESFPRVAGETFWSQALGTKKRYVAYLPPSYTQDSTRRYPVAYYLHGFDGDETNWTQLGHLDRTLDSLIAAGMPELIVVMPDGDDSWYTTWNFLGDFPGCMRQRVPRRTKETNADYCVPWPHYDDYIARDLVAHIDSTYRTIADRRRRAIAGLSMGGYGALTIALVYPEVFSAAASHSGFLSPLLVAYDTATRRTRYARDVAQLQTMYSGFWRSLRLAFGPDTAGWWARDPGRRAIQQSRVGAPMPAVYIDVGMDDPFLSHARALRDVLRELQLNPDYFERSGAHDWAYWRANSVHSLEFLARHLSRP